MQCIIPEDNHVFLQGDQAGAEALIVAYECRRARFRKLFELGIKPHSYTALQIFTDKFRGDHPRSRYQAVDPETLVTYPEYKPLFTQIKESQREYDLGKRVRHARNYKMGPRTFQTNCLEMSEGLVNLSYHEAKDFLETDSLVFPELVEWQTNDIEKKLRDTRVLYNLFGYPRQFTGIWSEALVRDACAFIPQSTVGTITNIAFTELHWKIIKEKLPWHLLNNKHDSILIEVPDTAEHREHGKIALLNALQRDLKSTRGEEYKMKAEIAAGYNWAKYDEIKNPQGMKEAV
jgi:hypothetical protein